MPLECLHDQYLRLKSLNTNNIFFFCKHLRRLADYIRLVLWKEENEQIHSIQLPHNIIQSVKFEYKSDPISMSI